MEDPPRVLITCHAGADADALASLLAASILHPRSWKLWPGSSDSFMLESFQRFSSEDPTWITSLNQCLRSFPPDPLEAMPIKKLVVVDTHFSSRLDHIAPLLAPAVEGLIDFQVYDHHEPREDSILPPDDPRLCLFHYGACVSVIFHHSPLSSMPGLPDRITPLMATYMGIGLYEDTECLCYSSTTKEDYVTAAWLLECGMNLDLVRYQMHLTDKLLGVAPEDVERSKAPNRLMGHVKTYDVGAYTVGIITASFEEEVGSISSIVQSMLDERVGEMHCLFAIVQCGTSIVLIGRSIPDSINVGCACQFFGGGGHQCAASARIRKRTVEEVKSELFEWIVSHSTSPKSVIKYMTKPVVTISSTSSLRDASLMFERLSLKKMPVIDESTEDSNTRVHIIGIIDRETVSKAIRHGFGDECVSFCMDASPSTLSPLDSIEQAMILILKDRQRIIPIINDDGALVGVISRSDVVQMIIHDSHRFPHGRMQQHMRNLSSKMSAGLDRDTHTFLRAAGALGDTLGVNVYVVGGFVRDLLLGKPNDDIDLVIEGDGLVYAKHLVDAHGSSAQYHEAFQTAVVTLHNGWKIDVATARLEYYPEPVSLPVVEPSALKMDLYRRDFTINALAVQLNKFSFGNLVDFFNGESHLRKGTVQVLHSLSFIDDPTRMFRAVRFEKRYAFSIGLQSIRFIRSAIDSLMIEKLSGTRLYHELAKIFHEDEPHLCFSRMYTLGMVKAMCVPLHLKWNKGALPAVHQVVQFIGSSGIRLNAGGRSLEVERVYMLALCCMMRHEEAKSFLHRLLIHGKPQDTLLEQRRLLKPTMKTLLHWLSLSEDERFPSTLYQCLRPLLVETQVVLVATYDMGVSAGIHPHHVANLREQWLYYLTSLRHVKSDITGRDLIDAGLAPNAAFRSVLESVLWAKMDGKAPTKRDQLELARSLYYKG